MGVNYERQGKVAILTIQGRTELNLFAPDTVYLPLYDAFMEYEADEDACCAILTGEGSKAFSAGGDLKAYEKLDVGYGREVGAILSGQAAERSLGALIRGDVEIKKPMIFAVNGLCLGAATIFVMCYADASFAVPHAKFGLPEIKWAIGGGGGSQLQRFLPWPIAMELYLTGRLMDAEEALRHGFINYVVPSDELMSAAMVKAEEIAAMPPLHIRRVKALMRADRKNSLAASVQMERLHGSGISYDHPDTREGILSFVEHRKPNWVGNRRQQPTAAGVMKGDA
jgi:enoyl-CoA hydratase